MMLWRVVALLTLTTGLTACSLSGAAPSARVKAVQGPVPARAKNVILFIGDGMGVSTVTAARIYDGQSRGGSGEENLLSFERFPNVALVKTYNTNQQVPDSAGTATAMNTGVKTRAGAIGIGPSAPIGDCTASRSAILPNIAELAHANGKAIGIVSTSRLTHATPAAVFAHAPDRDWEADSDIPVTERDKGCIDIASQLIAFPFDVALGGGRARFLGGDFGGVRLDPEANLISSWQQRTGGTLVTDAAGLERANAASGPLLGLFSPTHMQFILERRPDTAEPMLSQMATAAIDRLARDPDGFFLMVESGNIDLGHHYGRADYALSEAQEFSRTIAAVLAKVDLSETLIVVTADHSHVFTIAGYPARGNPILGLARGVDDRGDPTGQPILATDGKPYSTLGYQNGPGAVQVWPRPAPNDEPSERKQALVPTGNIFSGPNGLSETHGGEDVALYATGPGADRARGVIEQNVIYSIIMRAFGLAN